MKVLHLLSEKREFIFEKWWEKLMPLSQLEAFRKPPSKTNGSSYNQLSPCLVWLVHSFSFLQLYDRLIQAWCVNVSSDSQYSSDVVNTNISPPKTLIGNILGFAQWMIYEINSLSINIEKIGENRPNENLGGDINCVCWDYVIVKETKQLPSWPFPIGNFSLIHPFLPGISWILNNLVSHLLFNVSTRNLQLWHTVYHINDQVETVNLVAHG